MTERDKIRANFEARRKGSKIQIVIGENGYVLTASRQTIIAETTTALLAALIEVLEPGWIYGRPEVLIHREAISASKEV
jgi:hypothetical protein